MDFYNSVLNCARNQKEWKVFRSLASNCGWIFPYEKTCIVCDRPLRFRFDNEQRLHAEGEAAIQFADGYSLHSYHGVLLPRKYGQLSPERWKAQWVLQEKNAELKRVLIQGIGYDKIASELQAAELDSWREYTLLRFDKIIDDIDGQPIYLLKMTCPSTGFIHALRVPPETKFAREAIRWINWGVDPEEIAVAS
ncbi:MAG: DUF6745 domain-containing protein [Xenococcaceae cyanobacterium]